MPKGHKRMGHVRIGKSKKMEGYYEEQENCSKAGSRFLAMMLSVAMVVPGTAFVPAEYSGAIEALAATIDIAEDFESGEPKGYVRGSGTLTVVEEEHAGKALQLSGRTQNWHTYAYDVSAYAGATANISVL